MRKIVTLSMAASAALFVAACGQSETASTTTDANAMVTEMNAGEAMEGTTTDTMTNVDGAMGATDNMMATNAMGSMESSNMMAPADNAMMNASNAM
ncbi:MAG: hypothetical protein ACKVOP_02355 [Sphingomonadaceae bacterium]